jgi:hypothetical protein
MLTVRPDSRLGLRDSAVKRLETSATLHSLHARQAHVAVKPCSKIQWQLSGCMLAGSNSPEAPPRRRRSVAAAKQAAAGLLAQPRQLSVRTCQSVGRR